MEIEEAVRRMGLADTYRDRHWNRAVKVTDQVVQKAEPPWLEGLLGALLRVESPTYPMRYGFPVALRRLADAPGGADRVRKVREFAAAGLAWSDVRYDLREVAWWLASAQPAEHLLAALATADPADELAACLLQETALRHDATAAAGFAERLRAAGHPLAGLPLRAAPAERDHWLPRYPGPARPDWSRPGSDAPPADGPADPGVSAVELDWPDARLALSAHRAWVSDDGYGTEARLFRLDDVIAPGDFGGSVLRVLGLESAGGAFADTRRVTTSDVLRTLFAGAAGGSAHGPRMCGAYRRLASWEALAALVGVEPDGLAAVERAADRCAWVLYTSDWHLQVHPSMDVGIAALRPDRRTVAVVAATDSD
ncbi:DUF6183 family protein [Actinomadura chibensis]|uniref:Uncharacterized protein n=1 Tax=Actinomadura chibensis TaxID=392828 RepID=A0A5D0NV00_9ACTN|nr:DUF6183 family protein [Actinomadura chibensis]TYB48029.1 hypothetical protein FXF69_01980 [Actinomadura chibensis]